MQVTLMHYTPLNICAHAIRTCWQSFDRGDNGGERDRELIDRVGNRYNHSSTLEHINYSWYIQGISRAVLQQISRHRLMSLSVKSTRYTLKELKSKEPFKENDFKSANEFIVLTGNGTVDNASIMALNNLQSILKSGVSNDIAKYCLPESYKTELTLTVNLRSLQNFIKLRSSKSALWEIRELANMIYKTLPNEHQYLFQPFIYNKN